MAKHVLRQPQYAVIHSNVDRWRRQIHNSRVKTEADPSLLGQGGV
jgi:hypothetical protein